MVSMCVSNQSILPSNHLLPSTSSSPSWLIFAVRSHWRFLCQICHFHRLWRLRSECANQARRRHLGTRQIGPSSPSLHSWLVRRQARPSRGISSRHPRKEEDIGRFLQRPRQAIHYFGENSRCSQSPEWESLRHRKVGDIGPLLGREGKWIFLLKKLWALESGFANRACPT